MEMEVAWVVGLLRPSLKIIAALLWTAPTPFFLVWGQVGEVGAHYCRGVVVN